MMFDFCTAIWVRASLVGVSVRSVVAQKKTDSMTEQEQLVCKMCNLKYDESSGRVHGGFTCHTCAAADRALRRNLGDRSEVQEFSKAEAMEFFREVKEAKEESPGKRLHWQTLRATLIHHATQRQITEFKSDVECTALPLSVYLAQGWEESVVKGCPSVFNETLGIQTYKVPVQHETWTQTFQRVQERVLTQEKAATLRKKKKGAEKDSGDDLDLPAAPKDSVTSKGEKNSEKKAAVEQRKLCASNVKVSGQAAKALGPLTNALTALDRLEARVAKANVETPEGCGKVASEVRRKQLETWSQACRDCVNGFELQKKVADEEKKSIGVLPFSPDCIKTLLKTHSQSLKSLKNLLPVKLPKEPKASAAQKRKAEADAGEKPAPKRRTKKTAP